MVRKSSPERSPYAVLRFPSGFRSDSVTTIVATLIFILTVTVSRADSITFSNIVAGELLTSSAWGVYSGYRQGDPGVTNKWYRWVVKVEKTGPEST